MAIPGRIALAGYRTGVRAMGWREFCNRCGRFNAKRSGRREKTCA